MNRKCVSDKRDFKISEENGKCFERLGDHLF